MYNVHHLICHVKLKVITTFLLPRLDCYYCYYYLLRLLLLLLQLLIRLLHCPTTNVYIWNWKYIGLDGTRSKVRVQTCELWSVSSSSSSSLPVSALAGSVFYSVCIYVCVYDLGVCTHDAYVINQSEFMYTHAYIPSWTYSVCLYVCM